MSERNDDQEEMDTTPAPDVTTVPVVMMSEPTDLKHNEANVTLLVEWLGGGQPHKPKNELQKALQTWANKGSFGACSVINVAEDGSAVIKIEPPEAVSHLRDLTGQELSRRDGGSVKILSIGLTLPSLKTEVPEDTSMSLPLTFPSGHELNQQVEQNPVSSAAASAAAKETHECLVPVSHFLYVNHIYKDEVQRIQKDNRVQMEVNVLVKFDGDQKGGDPETALSEFTNLVQKCLAESDGSTVPLKRASAEGLKDTLKILQSKESKLLLTASSEEITICGPRQSQDAVLKALNATTPSNSSTSFGEAGQTPHTSVNIDMNIQDPLVNSGLTIEESYWKLMNFSFTNQMSKIKSNFGVDFNDSSSSQGKVKVKVCYKRPGGNPAMESHAVRALLQLYQKIATSPMKFSIPQQGAAGFNGSTENWSNSSESGGASGGDVLNGGADRGKARDEEEDRCPICMDDFTNKIKLKCTHEFCNECLQKSKEAVGPTCPVCKDVFGMMEGNQPDGNMTWSRDHTSLPGFPGCGNITITYDIHGGRQTEKHPNPGQRFYGIRRTAYLPDNQEGNQVLHLLKKAFDQKLIFTVGTSRTTGIDNQVTWNDIHHKTTMTGGPLGFGYPDDEYLGRVKEELKAKGIV